MATWHPNTKAGKRWDRGLIIGSAHIFIDHQHKPDGGIDVIRFTTQEWADRVAALARAAGHRVVVVSMLDPDGGVLWGYIREDDFDTWAERQEDVHSRRASVYSLRHRTDVPRME
jgi:hypothetical protein